MKNSRTERKKNNGRIGQDRRTQADKRKFERNTSDRRGQDKRKETRREENVNEEPRFEDQVEGRNAVLELLESGKDINKIFVT